LERKLGEIKDNRYKYNIDMDKILLECEQGRKESKASQSHLTQKNKELEKSMIELSELVRQVTNYIGYLVMKIIFLGPPMQNNPMPKLDSCMYVKLVIMHY
jgi:hypothetical protein